MSLKDEIINVFWQFVCHLKNKQTIKEVNNRPRGRLKRTLKERNKKSKQRLSFVQIMPTDGSSLISHNVFEMLF